LKITNVLPGNPECRKMRKQFIRNATVASVQEMMRRTWDEIPEYILQKASNLYLTTKNIGFEE